MKAVGLMKHLLLIICVFFGINGRKKPLIVLEKNPIELFEIL
jgi:hypothetical protein